MGYTTNFTGQFNLDKPLSDKDYEFLRKLNETRRMIRNLPPKYGVDGEFFVDGSGLAGQDRDKTIIDYNCPPSTQPGLWCGWMPTDDKTGIEWDGREKFYNYIKWIEYIVEKILIPRGYVLNGEVSWIGEDPSDLGLIVVKNNEVITKQGKVIYE